MTQLSSLKKQELAVDETVTLQTKFSGGKRNGDPSMDAQATGQVPLVCDFRGIREIVMTQTWQDADKLTAQGVPLTSGLWGTLVRRNWAKAKELAKQQCRPISPEEINRLLGP